MANNMTITENTPIVHKGVDISKHNGYINWSQVDKNEIDFVILRAGYGFNTVDPRFKEYIEGAIKAGLDIGIYWFSYAHNASDAMREAQRCVEVIEPYRKYIKYPVWFDWEYDSDNYVRKHYGIVLNKAQVSAIAKSFMQTIIANGYETGNYANPDYLNRYFTEDIKNNYDLWLAHVKDGKGNPLQKSPYKGKYTMHQYSWVGIPKGFSSNTDMDYAYFNYVTKEQPAPVVQPVEVPAVEKHYQVPEGIKFYTDTSKNVIVDFSYKSKSKLFVSDHFQVYEFASIRGQTLYSNRVLIHNKLIILLEALFKELNCSKMIVNSGYRTEAHDKVVGGSGSGWHTKGRAADITCYDKKGNIIPATTVCMTLESMGGVYGIGFISHTSVHVDTRPPSQKWHGVETIPGNPSLARLGYKNFKEYFEATNKI